ncbi:hypothetical protein ASA1KI_07630 [Opitutales bacterium ASA1]|uniref:hypothetical protein n=1 Tax=Congregicoccus parvus TaxID=3081749 RepID=UPI002B31A4F4|nr:hypothetical protein ASA1KI_07630 [Opitutales bacterium ASA1]
MSLFLATSLTALVLLLAAAALIWNGPPVGALARRFPRSRRAAWVTMGLGAAWTLYRITQLGEADFGDYRTPIFIGFAVLAVAVFRYVPDFLSVRGACVLALLSGDALLSAAYMRYDEPGRLLLVALVYAAVVLALWLAVSPFRVRDFAQWLFARSNRPRIVGACAGVYGLALLVVALGYS